MIAALLVLSQLGNTPKILFIGNSHTYVNKVPESVRQLLAVDSNRRKAFIRTVSVGLLETSGPEAENAIRSENWDVVVLQGAQVSSSHKYRYSQAKGIALANLALGRKAKVLLCAEWPRRGWDESEYQLGVYREIQSAAKGSIIVPICQVWDASRSQLGGIDLWQEDGNHANPKGSFLSACTIYRYLTKDLEVQPSWRPSGVSQKESEIFHSMAIHSLKSHKVAK